MAEFNNDQLEKLTKPVISLETQCAEYNIGRERWKEWKKLRDDFDRNKGMSLGGKEINNECDRDEEPPFCEECSAIWLEEMRLTLDANPKPMLHK